MDRDDVIAASTAWDEAMVANDAAAIGAFMTDDWSIVGQDGSVAGKAAFLALIASGDLTHDVMRSDEMDVRLHGDMAVLIARGWSGGLFKGQPFLQRERASSIFIRQNGRWRCVLTHLSTMAEETSPDRPED